MVTFVVTALDLRAQTKAGGGRFANAVEGPTRSHRRTRVESRCLRRPSKRASGARASMPRARCWTSSRRSSVLRTRTGATRSPGTSQTRSRVGTRHLLGHARRTVTCRCTRVAGVTLWHLLAPHGMSRPNQEFGFESRPGHHSFCGVASTGCVGLRPSVAEPRRTSYRETATDLDTCAGVTPSPAIG